MLLNVGVLDRRARGGRRARAAHVRGGRRGARSSCASRAARSPRASAAPSTASATSARPIDATHGRWRPWGDWIASARGASGSSTTLLLAVMALGLLNYSTGLTQGNSFRGDVESIQGQELLSKSFPSGDNAPTDIVVPDAARGRRGRARGRATSPGVADVRAVDDRATRARYLQASLELDPYSTQAFDVIPADPRRAARRPAASGVLVGGSTAIERDLRAASRARQPGDHPARPAGRLPDPDGAAAGDRGARPADGDRRSCRSRPRSA